MKIVNLIEDTEGQAGCAWAHGLSFYLETQRHKLLLDLGPSEETLRNAERLGIDLRTVDTVVISHGHYDHTGGLLAFSRLCPDAPVYLQHSALGNFYADDGESAANDRYRYIGMDKRIAELPQLRLLDGDHRIDESLSLFVTDVCNEAVPFPNARILERKNRAYLRDGFSHEQAMVIQENGQWILLSGCAHCGILNILAAFQQKERREPDAVVSGFHLAQKAEYTPDEVREIVRMAEALKQYRTRFYTCHCTGLPAFRIMKQILGDQLTYVHSGDKITLI